MNQLLSHSRWPFPTKWSVLFKDTTIALGWAFLLGIPLFVLHMTLFDFEHDQHIGNTYSFIQSITGTILHHPISLTLWLSVIFIAAFAIRRAFQQKGLLIQAQEKLALARSQALTDGLTGVWNRSGFEQLFEITIKRGRDQNRPFSIILGDVDRLKEYNDTYGHPAADEALKNIAQVISTQIRASDAVARYGGDEFAIFCFDLERDGAEYLLARIKAALKASPLSMSFGIASFPIDGQDIKALIEKSDFRLYQAKAENKILILPAQRSLECKCGECKCGIEETYMKPSTENI